jgi:hypothetical protein
MYAKQRRKPWEDSSLDTLLPGWRVNPDQPALASAFEAGKIRPANEIRALGACGRASTYVDEGGLPGSSF